MYQNITVESSLVYGALICTVLIHNTFQNILKEQVSGLWACLIIEALWFVGGFFDCFLFAFYLFI